MPLTTSPMKQIALFEFQPCASSSPSCACPSLSCDGWSEGNLVDGQNHRHSLTHLRCCFWGVTKLTPRSLFLSSDVFEVGGYEWKLEMYPYGDSQVRAPRCHRDSIALNTPNSFRGLECVSHLGA